MIKVNWPIQKVVLDIEGTVSDIRFVKETLFPYSLERLHRYLHDHQQDKAVAVAIASTLETCQQENLPAQTLTDAESALKHWIHSDRKHPALKNLQGLIWQEGYEQGVFKSHLYPEVCDQIKKWHTQGLEVGIYSSGSAQAQLQFFRHTVFGDLTLYLKFHFDLAVGGKREPESYAKISQKLNTRSNNLVFFSDVPEELKAAQQVGINCVLICRDSWIESAFPTAKSLTGITW